MSSNDPMKYNFDLLKERIFDTLRLTNIDKQLKKIKGNTICVGSGGSKVVASFASQILSIKNKCFSKVMEPRDALYENNKNYKNLLICSYSGNNHGVDSLKLLNNKKYLLTYGNDEKKSFLRLKCESSLTKEMSFISLAATLMPMTVLLSYIYKDKTEKIIDTMLNNIKKENHDNLDSTLPFDLMSGNDTLTPETYLESTFVESGLSNLTVHHKYDYCHGRSTLAYKSERNLIYLIANRKELDTLLIDLLKTKYKSIIILESNYQNLILDNYYLTLQAMYLTKSLAETKNIDLSIVEYDKPLCKVLYKYHGEM